MPGRQTHPDAKDSTAGAVYVNLSFTTNGTSQPVNTYAAGAAAALARGEGMRPTGTFTRTGVGTFSLVLDAGYTCRYVIRKFADLEANVGGDGSYGSITAPSQGEGDGKALTFTVYTHAAAGTLTDFTGRRLSIDLMLKTVAEGF